MNKVYVVYLITNRFNGKQYVGLDSNWPKRQTEHRYTFRNGKHKNKHLRDAAAKYGVDAFVFSVLQTCTTKEEMKAAEVEWIKQLQTCAHGYNLTMGGDGVWGYIMSQSQKDAIVARNKAKVYSPEERQNMSSAQKKVWASNRKQRIACLAAGRTPETFAKISVANTGEGSGRAILTEAAVLAMRTEWPTRIGITKTQFCREYSEKTGAGYYAIFDALSGKSWDHLPGAIATSGVKGGMRSRGTHCRAGHEYAAPEHYSISSGKQKCRTCRNKAKRLAAAKKKDAQKARP